MTDSEAEAYFGKYPGFQGEYATDRVSYSKAKRKTPVMPSHTNARKTKDMEKPG